MDSVKEELEFAGRVFAQNPVWPVIGEYIPLSYTIFVQFLFSCIALILNIRM